MSKRHKFIERNHTSAQRKWHVVSPMWRVQLKIFLIYLVLALSALAMAGYSMLILRHSPSIPQDYVYLPITLLIMQPVLLGWYLTRAVRLGSSMGSILLAQIIFCFMVIFSSVMMYPFFRASEESLVASLVVQDWCQSICPESVWTEYVEALKNRLNAEQCPLPPDQNPAI